MPAARSNCALGDERPCQSTLGACARGVEVCDAQGEFGACTVQPTLVDSCAVAGDDSNCDGVANDGCECTGAEERACGPALPVGVCAHGVSRREGGTWGACEGAAMPGPRQCGSPLDNDCDGSPPTSWTVSASAPQATRGAATSTRGSTAMACAPGTRGCVVSDDLSRARWSECTGAVEPLAGDLCDMGDDSNCNGVPNQGCDFTPPVVFSSLPEDGDSGVAADAALTVVFSEPMDRAATESAVELSSGSAEFGWNDAGTALTVTPSAPFTYAQRRLDALDSLPANESLRVGTGAKDLAGNGLLMPFEVAPGRRRLRPALHHHRHGLRPLRASVVARTHRKRSARRSSGVGHE